MSGIAEFYKIEVSKLDDLKAASIPQKRILGKPKDVYFDFLNNNSKKLREYEHSGYVFGTLLPFLDEKGIPLMESDYGKVDSFLTESRDSTHFIFTNEHKEKFLEKLTPSLFNENELMVYYNEFNEEQEPDSGKSMLDAISVLHDNLEEVDNNHVIVFAIF